MKIVITLLGLLFAGALNAAATFSDMFVFGDSLSDVGNLHLATGGSIPDSNYYMGRFSNGPVAAEIYGLREGLFGSGGVALTPSLAGGNNYAVAGALTGSHEANPAFGATTQVDNYLALVSSADPNALYLVWAGANDVRAALFDPANAGSIIATGVGNMQTMLTDLVTAGAQHILVPNVPDLGLIPEVTQLGDPAASAGATFMSTQFNLALDMVLDGFESSVEHLCRYDTFTKLNDLVAHGPDYGLLNVTDPFISSSDSDPDSYLFFDTIHPTAKVHNILGNDFHACPEPGTLSLALVGLAGIRVMRRRR